MLPIEEQPQEIFIQDLLASLSFENKGRSFAVASLFQEMGCVTAAGIFLPEGIEKRRHHAGPGEEPRCWDGFTPSCGWLPKFGGCCTCTEADCGFSRWDGGLTGGSRLSPMPVPAESRGCPEPHSPAPRSRSRPRPGYSLRVRKNNEVSKGKRGNRTAELWSLVWGGFIVVIIWRVGEFR